MHKLEAAKQLMEACETSLKNNPNRQNQRRLGRELKAFMTKHDIRPSELLDYIESQSNEGKSM